MAVSVFFMVFVLRASVMNWLKVASNAEHNDRGISKNACYDRPTLNTSANPDGRHV